jgi:hypothetical protein
MGKERPRSEEQSQVEQAAQEAIPRIRPRLDVAEDRVSVEFRVEDLVKRIIPSAAGHCGGCYGCSGCSM